VNIWEELISQAKNEHEQDALNKFFSMIAFIKQQKILRGKLSKSK